MQIVHNKRLSVSDAGNTPFGSGESAEGRNQDTKYAAVEIQCFEAFHHL